MDKKDREMIRQFMWQVFKKLHPDYNHYQFVKMDFDIYSKGEEFEGTEYTEDQIQAYFMREALNHFGCQL